MNFTLTDLVEIAFRHRWKLLALPTIIMILTLGVVLFFPRTYQSTARLFLQIGKESLGVDPAAKTGGSTVNLMQSNRDEEVKSALEVIQSRGIFAAVVDRLGADYINNAGDSEEGANPVWSPIKDSLSGLMGMLKSIDPIDPREDAIIKVKKNFKAEAERNSTVLALTFESKSPEAAQKILEALIEVYRSEHLRIHRNPDSNRFLEEQARLLQDQWLEAKSKVAHAKASVGVLTTSGRKSALEGQLQNVDIALLENTKELTNNRGRIAEITTQLASTPERETSSKKSVPNDGADLMREKLYEAQIRLMDERARLAPNHPKLVATENQIKEANRIMAQETANRQETIDDVNPLYRDLKLDLKRQEGSLAGLIAANEKLVSQRQELLTLIREFNQSDIEIEQLEQQEAIARAKYTQYTDNVEEARLNAELEEQTISSVNIQTKPEIERKPVKPSKLLVALAGVFLAGAAVIGSIGLSERLDDRVRSEGELTRSTGVPVLATVIESPVNKRIPT